MTDTAKEQLTKQIRRAEAMAKEAHARVGSGDTGALWTARLLDAVIAAAWEALNDGQPDEIAAAIDFLEGVK